MVLATKDIEVPEKKIDTPPVTESATVDPVATSQSDSKSVSDEVSSSTALVTQPEESEVGQALRQFIGDARIVRGKGDRVYLQVMLNGNPMQYKLGSEQANLFIRQQAYKEKVLLKEKDVREINQTLKAFASMELKPVDVYLRVSPFKEGIEIDLGDEDNTRVRIAPGTVVVFEKGTGTLFYRTHLSLPMAKPSGKGDLNKLRKYVRNIEDGFLILFFAWISYTLAHPTIDSTNFVHLVILGPQGSGKSFTCKLLGKLLDPNVVPVQPLPKNAKDFMVASQDLRVLFIDNISGLSKANADILCGAATGTASISRKLFTDDGQHVMHLHIAAVLNGIHDFVTESDLVQRSLIFNLQQMDEKDRVSEKVLLAELEADLPEIMMGLFQLVADIFKALPDVEVTHPERMIDFCEWLAGYEKVDGVEQGTYQALYSETLQTAQLSSLLENDFASEVYKFAIKLDKPWKGTPAELFRALSNVTSINSYRGNSDWPKSVESMGKRLRTILPALNTQGIHISFSKSRERYIEITTDRIEEMY